MKPFILILFVTVFLASAYEEQSFPNLMVPTSLSPQNLVVSVQHRFYGRIDDGGKNFFGFATPVAPSFGLRYDIWKTLEANSSFYAADKEIDLGASYAFLYPSEYFKAQVEGEYYNFSAFDANFREIRRQAGCFLFGIETYPIIRSISPAVDLGYDFDKRKWGLGLGLNLTLLEGFDVFGEYFPLLYKNTDSTATATKNVFSFGMKFSTAGHHFLLFLQNSVDNPSIGTIGARHVMFGSDNKNLHFGFEIERLFAF
jgi:Membrane bound beta barrel domain (DUF5777)